MKALDILFFGTYDERTHPRVRVLREGLEGDGHKVRTCNVPLGLDTAARVAIASAPWRTPILLARILVAWARLWAMAWRSPRPDVVVVGYLGQLDVRLARVIFRCPVVLDLMVTLADTARDRSLGSGRLHRFLERLDNAAVAAADLVVVDTQDNRSLVPASRADDIIVTPVGAPAAWHRPPARTPEPDGVLTVVFFGLFTPLQGAPVIGEAISMLAAEPAIRFTMIGAGQDLEPTKQKASANRAVRWLPWVEPEALVELVAGHHVCLGIFGDGDKARRVVPNKVYQGAAAGCAVVTSDTPAQRQAMGDAARYVKPGSAADLACELRRLAGLPDEVRRLRADAHQVAVERYSPDVVTRELSERLSEIRS